MVSTYRHKALRVHAIAKLCLRMYEDKPNFACSAYSARVSVIMGIVGVVVAKTQTTVIVDTMSLCINES